MPRKRKYKTNADRQRAYRNRLKKSVHFRSESCEWATPQDLFDQLNAEFGFETDVCATAENAKCSAYFTKEQDGLRQEWKGVCWMNPPYGREIGKWVKKAYESNATVVCLLPARTDTRWWHDYCAKGEIRFLKGRLSFNGFGTAPFPSAVVILGDAKTRLCSNTLETQ
jgi:phage N-6-adenine-methyltransferase